MSASPTSLRERDDKLDFVVLRHEGVPDPHFDLMFERSRGSKLATWRSDVWPVESGTTLVRLADHRREYLTYEGPVSGDRGSVRRIVSGTFRLDLSSDERWQVSLITPPPVRRWTFVVTAGDVWTVLIPSSSLPPLPQGEGQ